MSKKQIELTTEQEELAGELTKLQRETVINVECHGMKQVQAYQAAGGKSTGKTAEVTSSKLLSRAKVKAFRQSFAKESLKSGIMTRDEALEDLTFIARLKMTDVADFKNAKVGEDDDGNPVYQTVWVIKNSEDMDPRVAACIKSVTITKTGPKVELHDSMLARKMLGDMQGWNAAQKFDHRSGDGSMTPTFGSMYGKPNPDEDGKS